MQSKRGNFSKYIGIYYCKVRKFDNLVLITEAPNVDLYVTVQVHEVVSLQLKFGCFPPNEVHLCNELTTGGGKGM